jgi:hypothetical protein
MNLFRIASLVALVALLAAFLFAQGQARGAHDCAATLAQECVVSFDAPMQEDEFHIDYRGGKLHVERIVP